MQGQFGDGGHGWMYPGNPVRRFGFENIRLGLSDRWTVRTIVTNSERGGNLFGFAGAEFRATDGPTFTMHAYDESPGDVFEKIGILYFASPGVEEGSVYVSVNGDRYQETFETTPASSGIHWIEVPRGNHSVTLSYFLPGLRYYGIISELSGPGVVVDNVGLVSSRMRFLDKIGEEHWRDQIRLRDPDLMSFLYGGNAAGESKEAFLRHEDDYKQEYEVILDQLRENNPEVDCLMMNVLTRAKREGGRIEVYGAIPEIARAQREIAAENECALFDLYALMGGKEGAEAWFRNSPQLLGSDLSHPTRAGYEEIARAFYTELMYAFADYLEERAERIAAGYEPLAPLEEATGE
jgi:lysophospholipase L1-like esterase